MIPGNRFRARRINPVFDQCLSATATNAEASLSITTADSTTLIIVGSNNIVSGLNISVDGVAASLLGTIGSMKLFSARVDAGAHTVLTSATGSWRTIIVSAYRNVTSIGSFTSVAATFTNSPAVSPAGAGYIAVAGFIGAQASAAGTTSASNIRAKQASGSSNYNLCAVDDVVSPVGITQTSASTAVAGVWLS